MAPRTAGSPPPPVLASTADGIMLPVIDVSHPAFTVPDGPEAVEALRHAHDREERRRARMPRFVLRLLFGHAARRSRLVQALVNPQSPVLGGLPTYVMKLGEANLVPPFDRPIDRRLAAAPLVASIRIRLQQLAGMMAGALARDLAAAPDAPLHLVDIGGGPAIDSLDALILLRRDHPGLMSRPVTIHVLDADSAGPHFGANALAALQRPGGALAGTAVSLRHQPYDWTDARPLARLLAEIAPGAVVASSSEGALFEYGDDASIVANLEALRGAAFVAGTVTRADDLTRRMVAGSRFRLVPRGLEGFAPLAARAGFAIVEARSAVLSDQVLLRLA